MRLKALLVAFLTVASVTLSAQTGSSRHIPLDKGWKFNSADDPSFAKPGIDDKTWKSVNEEHNWDDQGYDRIIGFAWYRLNFTLPVAMRNEDKLREGLILALGTIDDGDQVFLNGQFLGQNGRTFAAGTEAPADFSSGRWDQDRLYRLAVNDPRLKWGQENLIAIRVANPTGQGGMYGGGQHLRVVGIKSFLDFQAGANAFIYYGNEVVKSFDIVNRATTAPMQGILTVSAVGLMSGRNVVQNKRAVNLSPGQRMSINLQLGQRQEACRINYHIAFVDGDTFEYREESPYILTPAASRIPRINGAMAYGARPGKPFSFTVAASGDRPMTFGASGLPESLRINPQTGIITGITPAAGIYKVTITASNARGGSSRDLEIVSGDKLALTPPMGWNSWNAWGLSVDEAKVLTSARAMVEKGLRDHGWVYVNVDDAWQVIGTSGDPKRDSEGNILTNNKFPDMTRLGRRIHRLGLKFGIYSSPGPLTCGGYTGSYQFEQNDANSYAAWGVDYLKYDWCSYSRIAPDSSLGELKKPYEIMRDALGKVDRDIVYSLCQYGLGNV
jgi:hypothetical protein